MNEKLAQALSFRSKLKPCEETLKEIILVVVGQIKDEKMLREVNSEVVSRINDCIVRKEQDAARGWAVGDMAKFFRESELRFVTIKISSINWKSVSGYEIDKTGKETSIRWRVAPSQLQKAA